MPEISINASFNITISFQAQERARKKQHELVNSVVMVIFAGFYVESCLNFLIERLKEYQKENGVYKTDLREDAKISEKVNWFYKKTDSATTWEKETERNPLLLELFKFRNYVAHGKDIPQLDFEHALTLRNFAKEFIENLRLIASKTIGKDIPRNETYSNTMKSYGYPYLSNEGSSDSWI